MACIDQKSLYEIFPPEKSNEFFDALYGGAEEGAYDIHLACQEINADAAHLLFELRRRPGKCLACSLTHGLPAVFQRHPVINLEKTARKVADKLGWGQNITWKVGNVEEISEDLHVIPFEINTAKP